MNLKNIKDSLSKQAKGRRRVKDSEEESKQFWAKLLVKELPYDEQGHDRGVNEFYGTRDQAREFLIEDCKEAWEEAYENNEIDELEMYQTDAEGTETVEEFVDKILEGETGKYVSLAKDWNNTGDEYIKASDSLEDLIGRYFDIEDLKEAGIDITHIEKFISPEAEFPHTDGLTEEEVRIVLDEVTPRS